MLAREELGLNPDDLGSRWGAAAAPFVTFAGGAAVPLVPLLLGATGARAVLGSAAITLLTAFVVGLGWSLFTGRAALRMVLIGGGRRGELPGGQGARRRRRLRAPQAPARLCPGDLKTVRLTPRWRG